VLVLDVDDLEALKLLATLDPLAAMAGADAELLRGLLESVETENRDVRAMLDQLLAEHVSWDAREVEESSEVIVPTLFQVVVECSDEHEQRGVFERLTAEGFKCRAMVL
jgi:hypothetical protein